MSKKNNNNKSNSLDREEYGFGYDVSPDDLDVYVQNNNNQKKINNEVKDKKIPIKGKNSARDITIINIPIHKTIIVMEWAFFNRK